MRLQNFVQFISKLANKFVQFTILTLRKPIRFMLEKNYGKVL